jgi:hypothetical protein
MADIDRTQFNRVVGTNFSRSGLKRQGEGLESERSTPEGIRRTPSQGAPKNTPQYIPDKYKHIDVLGDTLDGHQLSTFSVTITELGNADTNRPALFLEELKRSLNATHPGSWEGGIRKLTSERKWTQMYFDAHPNEKSSGSNFLTRSQAEIFLGELILGFSANVAERKDSLSEYFSQNSGEIWGTLETNQNAIYDPEEMKHVGAQLDVPLIDGAIALEVIIGVPQDTEVPGYYSGYELRMIPRKGEHIEGMNTLSDIAPDFPSNLAVGPNGENGIPQSYISASGDNDTKVWDFQIGRGQDNHFKITINFYPHENHGRTPSSDTLRAYTLSGQAADDYLATHNIRDFEAVDQTERFNTVSFVRRSPGQPSAQDQYFSREIDGYARSLETNAQKWTTSYSRGNAYEVAATNSFKRIGNLLNYLRSTGHSSLGNIENFIAERARDNTVYSGVNRSPITDTSSVIDGRSFMSAAYNQLKR